MARPQTIKVEIKIPKGFKLLKVGEKVKANDYMLFGKKNWRILEGRQENVLSHEKIIRELEW